MPRLKYADFYDEQMEVRGWQISQIHAEIERQFPELGLTPLACAEFLRGRHTPHADVAAAFEQVFGVNLPPRYYCRGRGMKP